MPVNADKPQVWKADVAQSAGDYDDWYLRYAPQAYRDARNEAANRVEEILRATGNLTAITPEALRQDPRMLATLRMMTDPPIARDTLIGVTHACAALVTAMERDGHIPPQLFDSVVDDDLTRIGDAIMRLADRDIFSWLDGTYHLTGVQLRRAATIVGDRLCLASADAVIRDAQKRRQLAAVKIWLNGRGYSYVEPGRRLGFDRMVPGTFTFELNVPVMRPGKAALDALPIDVAVMPHQSNAGDVPLLIDTRASGDYARSNRRRVEDAAKLAGLRGAYGAGVRFVLFLSGYFDGGYLGYVAAEGIDWVWEHRVDDMAQLDLAKLTLLDRQQVAVAAH